MFDRMKQKTHAQRVAAKILAICSRADTTVTPGTKIVAEIGTAEWNAEENTIRNASYFALLNGNKVHTASMKHVLPSTDSATPYQEYFCGDPKTHKTPESLLSNFEAWVSSYRERCSQEHRPLVIAVYDEGGCDRMSVITIISLHFLENIILQSDGSRYMISVSIHAEILKLCYRSGTR